MMSKLFKVNAYLPEHDLSRLEIKIMKLVDAMKFSLERIRRQRRDGP